MFLYFSCFVSSSPATGDWRTGSALVGDRSSHSGAVVGDKIYLVASSYVGHRQTTEYGDGERWEEGPRLPHVVGGGSCTVTTSPTTILVMGGNGDGRSGQALNKVIELNITSGKWRYLPDTGEKRYGHGCTVID